MKSRPYFLEEGELWLVLNALRRTDSPDEIKLAKDLEEQTYLLDEAHEEFKNDPTAVRCFAKDELKDEWYKFIDAQGFTKDTRVLCSFAFHGFMGEMFEK